MSFILSRLPDIYQYQYYPVVALAWFDLGLFDNVIHDTGFTFFKPTFWKHNHVLDHCAGGASAGTTAFSIYTIHLARQE
jgi:hypothetical protein